MKAGLCKKDYGTDELCTAAHIIAQVCSPLRGEGEGGALWLIILCVHIPSSCQLLVIHNGQIVPRVAKWQLPVAAPWSSDMWLQTVDSHWKTAESILWSYCGFKKRRRRKRNVNLEVSLKVPFVQQITQMHDIVWKEFLEMAWKNLCKCWHVCVKGCDLGGHCFTFSERMQILYWIRNKLRMQYHCFTTTCTWSIRLCVWHQSALEIFCSLTRNTKKFHQFYPKITPTTLFESILWPFEAVLPLPL